MSVEKYSEQYRPALDDYVQRYPIARLSRNDGILEVRFQGPDGGPQRWSANAHEDLYWLLRDIAADRKNAIVILTGTGDAYMPGRPDPPARSFDPEAWEGAIRRSIGCLLNLLEVPVPVIAALNGPVAIHAEIPLLSDIVIATPSTYIQDEPHLLQGMLPGDGLHVVMPLLMGRLRASYFLLTGEQLSAAEAKDMGLINEIVERDDLMPRARTLAQQVKSHGGMEIRYTRMLLTQSIRSLLHEQLGYGLALEGLAAIHRHSPG